MKSEARELDQVVRDWWLRPTPDDALFQRVAERALTSSTTSLVPFARALRILDTRKAPVAIEQRLEELRTRLDRLRVREQQVDDLGNLDNEPLTVFAILGDEPISNGFDPERLRSARLHQHSRAAAAGALLETLGWNKLPHDSAEALQAAIADLSEREQYESWGLFVNRSAGEGLALGVKLVLNDSTQVFSGDGSPEMVDQARVAMRAALGSRGCEAKLEWPASYSGESIGLPLYIAGLVASGRVLRDALTASTGRIEIDGAVIGVTSIPEKIDAAYRIGMRRVLVPRENFAEAKEHAEERLVVVPITNVREVESALRQPVSAIELDYAALIRLVRASAGDYRLLIESEIRNTNGYRFTVANTSGKASIWVYPNGRVRPEGASGPTFEAAAKLVAERVPGDPEDRQPLSLVLPAPLQSGCLAALQDAGFLPETPGDHEKWRLRLAQGRSRVTVVLYNSGKCVLQGTAPAWEFALKIIQQVTEGIGGVVAKPESRRAASEVDSKTRNESEPHIGTDEAGKGDYFGPLVSAAVYVDHESAARLRQIGVRDSKTLSDARVRQLAKEVRQVAEGKYTVTPINPRKYNELLVQFRREGKNLNSLLAWGHARSIDGLLSSSGSKGIHPKFVIVDQFADERYIEERTRRAGIPIHQRHKAEADIAVAAASILARDAFLQWLERWSQRTQIPLPKGASPQVIEAAKQFVRRWGSKWLGEVAKISFRTTGQVLEGEDIKMDTPVPPWADESADSARES
jgi:ribonuclease HIII